MEMEISMTLVYVFSIISLVLLLVAAIIGAIKPLQRGAGTVIGILSLVFAMGCAKIPLAYLYIETAELYGMISALMLPLGYMAIVLTIAFLYRTDEDRRHGRQC